MKGVQEVRWVVMDVYAVQCSLRKGTWGLLTDRAGTMAKTKSGSLELVLSVVEAGCLCEGLWNWSRQLACCFKAGQLAPLC